MVTVSGCQVLFACGASKSQIGEQAANCKYLNWRSSITKSLQGFGGSNPATPSKSWQGMAGRRHSPGQKLSVGLGLKQRRFTVGRYQNYKKKHYGI